MSAQNNTPRQQSQKMLIVLKKVGG